MKMGLCMCVIVILIMLLFYRFCREKKYAILYITL